MTKIETFAKEKLGIRLTIYQVEMIRQWSVGATVTAPKRAGVSTARKVLWAYLQDGVSDERSE